MKTLYTLLISACLMVHHAQAASELFLKINKSGRYTVTIDDNTMSSRNNIFRFYDLNNGNYVLRVTQNNFFNTVVYERPINLQNGYRTVAELDHNWNLQIIHQLPYQQTAWYLDQVYPNGNGYPNNPNYPQGNYPPLCPKHHKPTCYHPHGNGNGGWNPNYPHNPGNGYPNPYPQYPNYPPTGNYPIGNVMDNTSVQNLKTTMKNMTFDDSMLQVAKTALKNAAVTTSQVGDLMSVFTFENNKLEFAKYAYDKTVDRHNYFQLYDDFTFNSNATELDKYIASR